MSTARTAGEWRHLLEDVGMEVEDAEERLAVGDVARMRLLRFPRQLAEQVRDDVVEDCTAAGAHHRVCGEGAAGNSEGSSR